MKVCIVSSQAYPLFNRQMTGRVAENALRAKMLADVLSSIQDFELSIAVASDAIDGFVPLGPFRLFNNSVRSSRNGVGLIRHLINLLRDKIVVLQGMKRLHFVGSYAVPSTFLRPFLLNDADVYCVFEVDHLSVCAVAYAKSRNKRIVFVSGNQLSYAEQYHKDSPLIAPNSLVVGDMMFHFLDAVDTITVSSARLEEKSTFHKELPICRLALPLPPPANSSTNDEVGGRHVMWMGATNGTDHTYRILDVARRYPDVPFIVAEVPPNATLEQGSRKKGWSNVKFVGNCWYGELEEYFMNAAVVVITSQCDDYTVPFLLAARYGRPVVSLFDDADGVIQNHRIGLASGGSPLKLCENLTKVLSSTELWRELSDNMVRYAREVHGGDELVDEWQRLLQS